MRDLETEPIMRVQWVDVDDLHANGWNPNHVMKPELVLLERSILEQGWIQPLIVTPTMMIIDGFHRATLSKVSVRLREEYGGKVPAVVMDLDTPDAMMLTVRINRAKGRHAAIDMSTLVRALIDTHGCDSQEVATGIGATMDEIYLLYQDDLFKALKLDAWDYSHAWVPEER